jgi:hypothetical protein
MGDRTEIYYYPKVITGVGEVIERLQVKEKMTISGHREISFSKANRNDFI